jgi:hypothetical protein
MWQVAGFTALNTWGKLTPLADVTGTPDEALLKSNSDGGLFLKQLDIGPAGAGVTLYSTNDITVGPDIFMPGNSLIAVEGNFLVAIDSDNTAIGNAFIIGHNAATSSFAEIARFVDNGRLGIGNSDPTYQLDVTGSGRVTSTFYVGDAFTLHSTNAIGTGPDIQFDTNGLISAEQSIYLALDSDNNDTGTALIIGHNAATSAFTELFRFTDGGRLGVGVASPSYAVDVLGSVNTTVAVRTVDVYATTAVQTPEVNTGGGRLSLAPASGVVRITAAIPIIDTGAGTSLFLQPAQAIKLDPGNNRVELLDGKGMQTEEFVSGFAGNGFRMDQGISRTGKTSLELDDLVVRGRMYVYELIIRQIRATNGSLFVTSTAEIKRVAAISGGYTLYTTTAEETPTATTAVAHGFLPGDIIRAQRTRWNGTTLIGIYQSDLRVTTVTSLYEFNAAFISGDAPEAGFEFVRLGNNTDTSRQGSLYLTADDTNAPFMDVVDGITSHADWNTSGKVKVRIGKLTGITAQVNEYGIIAGNGGFADSDQWIRASSYAVELHNTPLNFYQGSTLKIHIGAWNDVWFGPSSADKRLSWNGTTFEIVGKVTATSGTIANWDIGVVDANTISSTSIKLISGAAGTARLEVGASGNDYAGVLSRATATAVVFWAGRSYANLISSPTTVPFRVTLAGDLYASNADITGNVNALTGTIANWNIGVVDANTISNSTNFIRLIAGGVGTARLEVGDGTTAGTGGGVASRSGVNTVVFWAGALHASSATAPFRVTLAGAMTATSADITGNVNAATGTIANWNIGVVDANTISNSSNHIRLIAGGAGTARLEVGDGTTAGTGGGVVARSTGPGNVFWSGSLFASSATAPFRVTSAGALTSTSATFGTTTLVDTTGVYINAQTAWDVNYGYKFKIAGNVGAGMTSVYVAGDQATTQIWHNTNTESSISPLVSGINASLILRSVAGGAGKSAFVELTSAHSSSGTTARFVLSHDGTTRTARIYGSAFYFNNGSDRIVWHEGNLDPSGYATNASLSGYAPLASPSFTGTVILPITKYSPRTSSSAPTLADGEVMVFTIYNGTVHRYVIAYNHGGTIKYRYWNLDETGVPVWNYSTTFSGVYD